MTAHAWLAVAMLAALLGLRAVSGAADEPLTLDDVAALRAERQSPGEILRAAKQRGRGFTLDDAARERLKSLGFSNPTINALAKVDEVDSAADAAEVAGGDAEAEAIDRIVTGAVAEAGVRFTVVGGARCRVFSGPGVPPQLAADARQVEARLAAALPKSFVAGIDKRAVNLLIVASRSEYAKLLGAVSGAGESNGMRFATDDGRGLEQLAGGKAALYLPGVTTICLEAATPEQARRTVAHAVGFHALQHASRRQAGDALASGFGSVVETLLFNTPSVTVAGGYADREVGGAEAWPLAVKQRVIDQQIRGLAATLGRSLATMEMPDYAECWSLTAVLARDPKKFAAAITSMRDGAAPLEAILAAYGKDEETLVMEWQQAALQAAP